MFYTLKIYDTELMTFDLTQKPLEGFLSGYQREQK
jgi:hypothetical protein